MEITAEERAEVEAIKARAAAAAETGTPESLGRCNAYGVPLTARSKVAPIEGTILIGDDGQTETGVCSLCGTRAKLSAKRVLTAHVMRGETLPKSPALSEPNIIPTDTGSRVGDPEAGSRRRADDIDGAYERGTVEVKVKPENGKGKAKATEVPATLENLRLALAQELARKVSAPESVKARNALVASLRRRISAAAEGPGKVSAEGAFAPKGGIKFRTSGQRDEGRIDGVAMVMGPNMAPVQPQSGWAAKAGTNYGPIGRERVDRTIIAPEMAGGTYGYLTQEEYDALPRTQQRKYWDRVRVNKERAERARAYSAARPVEPREGGSVKSETERLMMASNHTDQTERQMQSRKGQQ